MKKLYTHKNFLLVAVVFAVFVWVLNAGATEATHSWANYHWSRSVNPLTLKVGDNVSSLWDGYLNVALSDWNNSTAVQLSKTSGLTSPRTCKPVAGRIEVCNSKYGKNGWLGIAQIWVSGNHITQAVTKLNDTYFLTATYNTPAWRQLVICQEVAHDFGLNHQDENFSNSNLGSCMDYTSDPDGPLSNEHPNTHDFDQLNTIYAHLDAMATSLVLKTNGKNQDKNEVDFSDQKEWGRTLRRDSKGNPSLYERDLGKGNKVVTHVLWAE